MHGVLGIYVWPLISMYMTSLHTCPVLISVQGLRVWISLPHPSRFAQRETWMCPTTATCHCPGMQTQLAWDE